MSALPMGRVRQQRLDGAVSGLGVAHQHAAQRVLMRVLVACGLVGLHAPCHLATPVPGLQQNERGEVAVIGAGPGHGGVACVQGQCLVDAGSDCKALDAPLRTSLEGNGHDRTHEGAKDRPDSATHGAGPPHLGSEARNAEASSKAEHAFIVAFVISASLSAVLTFFLQTAVLDYYRRKGERRQAQLTALREEDRT